MRAHSFSVEGEFLREALLGKVPHRVVVCVGEEALHRVVPDGKLLGHQTRNGLSESGNTERTRVGNEYYVHRFGKVWNPIPLVTDAQQGSD